MEQIAMYKESQKMYSEIKKEIASLSLMNSNEINWYQYVSNVIGLSDRKANDILWEENENGLQEVDWGQTYDELDILYGDTSSLIATIEDEQNKIY
ncbi:hypothetical protein BUY35_00300 [Staphylococcus cohnii]|nr:hypothetical protein BUY35_00300 [Staphylococcus cohnii]